MREATEGGGGEGERGREPGVDVLGAEWPDERTSPPDNGACGDKGSPSNACTTDVRISVCSNTAGEKFIIPLLCSCNALISFCSNCAAILCSIAFNALSSFRSNCADILLSISRSIAPSTACPSFFTGTTVLDGSEGIGSGFRRPSVYDKEVSVCARGFTSSGLIRFVILHVQSVQTKLIWTSGMSVSDSSCSLGYRFTTPPTLVPVHTLVVDASVWLWSCSICSSLRPMNSFPPTASVFTKTALPGVIYHTKTSPNKASSGDVPEYFLRNVIETVETFILREP